MEWVDKLEAKSGWREVETTEVSRLERRAVGLAAGEAGLTLAEGKNLVGELARLILQTQMEEFTTCARVCRDCLKLRRLRDQRTRTVQTLFGSRKLSSKPAQVSGKSHPGQDSSSARISKSGARRHAPNAQHEISPARPSSAPCSSCEVSVTMPRPGRSP